MDIVQSHSMKKTLVSILFGNDQKLFQKVDHDGFFECHELVLRQGLSEAREGQIMRYSDPKGIGLYNV